MKASEMIQELALQISEHGDREVRLCINTGEVKYNMFVDVDAKALGASLVQEGWIEIYGE